MRRQEANELQPKPAFEQLEPRLLLSAIDPQVQICRVFDPSLVIMEPDAQEFAAPVAAAFPLENTFLLHSHPSASKTIYLDFDGHLTSGTLWNANFNGGLDFTTPAYSFEGDSSFTDAELTRIQYIWERVVEDYLPFDVDVTTEDPGEAALANSGSGDTEWGTRVVIGGSSYDWLGQGAGGIAYLDSFAWNSDTPCFVFPAQLGSGHEKYTAEAASHETGHTLDLYHDGSSTVEYYAGHGSGPTGWAPIMGNGYYQELTQWSKGEYADANNSEDDLAIITAGNGFGYRADDHGDSLATASFLDINGVVVSGEGIIERTSDLDYFAFTTGDGPISLSIDPFYRSPNLDILASLYEVGGGLIATSNPIGALDASFSLSLTAGSYFISVDGIGEGTPPATGYSDYGSLGYYSIIGTIVFSGGEDRAIAETTVYGTTTAGDLTKTYASDDSYEAITEEKFLGNRSRLEHHWTFNVTGGKTVTFFVEAYHDSTVEDFVFEYSTDAATWIPMLTITKTADDDVAQSFELPSTTSGTVFVRVVDTDRSKDVTLDSLYVDDMWINSDLRGEIHGSKWHDLDADGVRDAGEPGLADWTIFLDDDNDGILDAGETSTLTDANGDYSFVDLIPTDYTVAEVPQAGWQQTFPTGNGRHTVTVNPAEIVTGIDFGNLALPGEIHGSKWHDLNANGIRDAGEPGLANWTIFLDDGNGTLDIGETSTVTDINGDFSFIDLIPGDYTVVELPQYGWQQTFPAGDGTHLLTLIAGQIVDNIKFGNRLPGDFDADSDVDGVDFGIWQVSYPMASGASSSDGDADLDGDVDGTDFGIWQANYPTAPPVPLPAEPVATSSVFDNQIITPAVPEEQEELVSPPQTIEPVESVTQDTRAAAASWLYHRGQRRNAKGIHTSSRFESVASRPTAHLVPTTQMPIQLSTEDDPLSIVSLLQLTLSLDV